MKKILKKMGIVALVVVSVITGSSLNVCAIKNTLFRKVHSSDTSYSYEYMGKEYGDWVRISDISSAGTDGERSAIFKGKVVNSTSSVSVGISYKDVEVTLGLDIDEKITTDLEGMISRDLSANEYCAYYYRDCYDVYNVTVITTTEYYGDRLGEFNTETTEHNETVKIVNKIQPENKGFFYSTNKSALKKKLSEDECTDRICIETTCPAH